MAMFKVEAAPLPPPTRAPMTDLAFFVTSYVACFIIIMGLIV